MEGVPECYMNSGRIQRKFYTVPTMRVINSKRGNATPALQNTVQAADSVSFQGSIPLTKQAKLGTRRLFDFMKDASEITNAFIAAIGTGIIAPAIIMVSPGKGDKEDHDKKFFQALRQPLSAGLALAFQLPATMFIMKIFDSLAYKLGYFKDKVLGTLIADKKYLKKFVTKEEYNDMLSKFEEVTDGKSLKQELEDKIRKEYKEVGIDAPSDAQIAKRVEKAKRKFILEKIVDKKHKVLIDAKVEELSANKFDIEKIKDIDLVTEEYKRQAIEERFKTQYEAIAKDPRYKLSWFDKTIKMMGFSNKKTKALEDVQKQKAKEWGLEILKSEDGSKEIFNDPKAKLRKYVENLDKEAQKTFKGKKYWFSLLVNLFMVTASCYALNWAHPRVKEQIDKFRNNNSNQQLSDDKKVEVK